MKKKETKLIMNFEHEYATNSDVSYKVLRQLNLIGMKPIKVPVRMNGISSKGEYMQCHSNVKKIVQKHGGKRLIGHTFKVSECGALEAFNHSVWITPENKVVDICKNQRTKEELEKGYVIFVPRMIDQNPDSIDKETIHYDFVLKGNKFYVLHPFGNNASAILGQHNKNKARIVLNDKYHYSLREMMNKNTYLEDASFLKILPKTVSMLKNYGMKVLLDVANKHGSKVL